MSQKPSPLWFIWKAHNLKYFEDKNLTLLRPYYLLSTVVLSSWLSKPKLTLERLLTRPLVAHLVDGDHLVTLL